MTQHTDSPPAVAPSAQKQALLEAYDTVLKQQAEAREAELREAAARRRARRRVRPTITALAVLVLALCSYLYIERPEWLFPAPAAPESLALKEASLRIGMANVAQHVERHRRQSGALPRTLEELGTRMEEMTYEVLGPAEWRLIGSHAGVELTLTSHDSLPKFIGNSFEVISRRGR